MEHLNRMGMHYILKQENDDSSMSRLILWTELKERTDLRYTGDRLGTAAAMFQLQRTNQIFSQEHYLYVCLITRTNILRKIE